MIDCTGNYTFPDHQNIYCLVAVCMQTKLVAAIVIFGRSADDFLRALNVLFVEQGTPRHLFIDAESALISVLKDGLNLTRDNHWEKHKIDVTTVAATDHHAHVLV